MSFSNVFENDLLKLIFQAVPIANLADNAATAPLTSLFVALHSADPGEAGAQNTSECSYGGYARVAVPRGSGGFTISANVVTLVADAVFPTCTSSPQTATHASIGTAGSGAGKILLRGALSPQILIAVGGSPAPTVKAASTLTLD
jgi:hypothetical protein